MMFRRVSITALVAICASVAMTSVSFAADTGAFQAGRIIDDAVFTNTSSMTVNDIQNFLNSKVPNCDTNHAGMTGGTGTVYNPQFICLKSFYENPSASYTVSFNYQDTNCNWQSDSRTYYYNNAYRYTALTPIYNNGDCHQGYSLKGTIQSVNGVVPSGAISAAQIIYNTAQQYQINPEVLIVLLQKEQGLITDTWPAPYQYQSATGYGCPDYSPCNQGYSGFSNQLKWAATMFHAIMINSPTWYTPYILGNNYIQYSPIASCGGTTVNIQNRATQALYNYTPYQPNTAALAAGYGTGDGCNAYGNRNFWLYFNDWFGSTFGTVNVTSPLTISSGLSQGLFTNYNINAQFTIKNNSAERQDLGMLAIGVRDQNGVNFDFGSQNIVLDPWQTYTYQATRTLNAESQYTFKILNYRSAYGWSETFPGSIDPAYPRSVTSVVQTMPTVSNGPLFDNTNLHVGQSTTLRMSITNNSTLYNASLGYFGVAMSSPSGGNADLPFDTVTSLAPGATYNYAKTFTPKEAGTYNGRVSSTGDGGITWSETRYPAAVSPATNRVSLTVKTNPTLTQGLTITPTTLYAGDVATGTFKIKNFSDSSVVVNKSLCYILRGPNGSNNDFGCVSIGTLTPGQELTYTGSRALTVPGQYRGYFSMFDGSWHDGWSFEQETGAEPTTINFTVKDNPLLSQGLTVDNMNPRVGDTVTGTFKVKNNSSSTVTVNKSLCYIMRSSNNLNYDLGCLPVTTIAAGQELTFSASRKINDPGQFRAYFSMFDGSWHDGWTFSQLTGSEPTTLQFSAKDTPTLTQGLTVSNMSPAVGSTINGTFKVKNNSSSTVTVNKSLCYILRGPNGSNNDFGCLNIGTLTSGQEMIYSGVRTINVPGQYRGYFSMFDGSWHDGWTFQQETGIEPTTVSFTVQ